jgi:hypothetical protein
MPMTTESNECVQSNHSECAEVRVCTCACHPYMRPVWTRAEFEAAQLEWWHYEQSMITGTLISRLFSTCNALFNAADLSESE